MLSKMAQPNNVGGGGGATSGRRVPMSLTGGVGTGGSNPVSRVQQSAGSNGTSKSPQNSNVVNKNKNESHIPTGPFVAIKKSTSSQQRSANTTSTASSSSSGAQNDEKKSQNGVTKPTNGNQKSSQNGNSSAATKDQQKQQKEKQPEKIEQVKAATTDDAQPSKNETKEMAAPAASAKKIEVIDVIDLDKEPTVDPVVAPTSTTPTSERKSSRRLASNQQKSPSKPEQSASPISKKQQEETSEKAAEEPAEKPEENPAAAVEDVEMETLAVEASPIKAVASAQPTATSTPGRNLFGFRSGSKQINEVELAAQVSSSPASTPARSFSQISGRRSIRPSTALTPGKLGSYRCVNSELDTSSCTNTSMNATVGSEIPNSSSFSFSFFGRGRKRERTPPPLTGSQSANDLAQDVEMSPPKRARFELFSLNLASPFSMLRTRFSKTTISTPSSRQRDGQTPPTGDDEEGGEVQNVSGIINQEEEEQQLNKSLPGNEVTVGQEAGLETPKKSGTPVKEVADEKIVEEQGEDAVANLPSADAQVSVDGEGPNRSRCAIM